MTTIELGYIPPASVRGNSRAHHMVKWRDNRKMRESGFWHASLMDIGQVKHLTLTFDWHHWRKIDLDNLSMKGFVDGIVDAGVVENDDPDHVSYGQHRFVRCRKGESKTIVEVTVDW